MWSIVDSVGKLAWRNRGKLTIAAAVGIGAAVYLHYCQSEVKASEAPITLETSRNGVTKISNSRNNGNYKLMTRARRQYDSICVHFLGTLRGRIVDVVDITAIIRQIKELRINGSSRSNEDSDAEAKLWDEIKIGSFTQLFVTAYTMSMVCVLLRVQMHILAKYSTDATSVNISDDQSSLSASAASDAYDQNISFNTLTNGTYKHLFTTGIKSFALHVREQVTYYLNNWKVNEKTSVEFNELIETLTQTRRSIERDISSLINIMIIPPEAALDLNSNSHEIGRDFSGFDVNGVLAQTWDICESPAFEKAFVETVDNCFKLIFEYLRENIFSLSNQDDVSRENVKSPPLASLLPHIKSISSHLLPTSDHLMTVVVRDLIDGPNLETLCSSVYEASN